VSIENVVDPDTSLRSDTGTNPPFAESLPSTTALNGVRVPSTVILPSAKRRGAWRTRPTPDLVKPPGR
jgi:hypothetical protein